MACIYGETIVIIDLWVMVYEQRHDGLAELRNVHTECISDTVSEPVHSSDLMDAKSVSSVDNHVVEVACELHQTNIGVRDHRNWAKRHEERNLIRVEVWVLSKSAVHLCSTLGVTNVSDFLVSSLTLNHVNDGWKIVLAHVLPGEVPELLLIMVRVQVVVVATEGVTTRVAEPHIITGAGCNECWCNVTIVNNPAVG